MRSALRPLGFVFFAVAAIAAVTGMRSGSKPESERAYFLELSHLHAVDKPRALALARQGDEWYGTVGANAEARKAMVITLLVDLGDMEQARRETRAFIVAYPQSSYRPLVQGVTGIHPRPSGPRMP